MSDVQYERFQFLFNFVITTVKKKQFRKRIVFSSYWLQCTLFQKKCHLHFNVERGNWMWKKIQTKCTFELNCTLSESKIMNNEIWTKFGWNCDTHWYGAIASEGRDTLNNYHRLQSTQSGAFIININVVYQLHTRTHTLISNIAFPFYVWNWAVSYFDWNLIGSRKTNKKHLNYKSLWLFLFSLQQRNLHFLTSYQQKLWNSCEPRLFLLQIKCEHCVDSFRFFSHQ